VGVAALMLAACSFPHPHHWNDAALKTISSLNCPDGEGDLMRKSAASDGKTCLYGDDAGDEVTLQLIDLSGGDAKTALAPLEAQLKAEMPATTASADNAGASDNDRVDIDLPGIHIHANGHDKGDNDHASIRINGAGTDKSTTVTDQNGQVAVSATKPGVAVDAGENGAQISVNEPGSGVRQSFILTSDSPGPNGYRMVGYEVRGPAAGPLVVASMKVKSDDHDSLNHDVRKLLRLNVGG
jgi:hypothetical protein